jgi:hypothetical protein
VKSDGLGGFWKDGVWRAPPCVAGSVDRRGRPEETQAPDYAGQKEYEDGSTENLS